MCELQGVSEASLASIVECIGVHTMVRQQRRAQAYTATLAVVHIGTQVFAVVGTK
jgi:hypothetical protein